MKRLFDYGQVIIFTCVLMMYVQRFFVTDLKGFLGTSGVVFAGLATLCRPFSASTIHTQNPSAIQN